MLQPKQAGLCGWLCGSRGSRVINITGQLVKSCSRCVALLSDCRKAWLAGETRVGLWRQKSWARPQLQPPDESTALVKLVWLWRVQSEGPLLSACRDSVLFAQTLARKHSFNCWLRKVFLTNNKPVTVTELYLFMDTMTEWWRKTTEVANTVDG